MDQAAVKKQGPKPPAAYRPQPVPKVLQTKMAAGRPSPLLRQSVSRVVQRAEAVEQAIPKMDWNEFVNITMPSRKHILELMNASDANGKMKISVVEQAVADEAVKAIGAHVKAHGFTSSDDITFVKAGNCWDIIYKGNHWMTHDTSGQLWPLKGPDIFSPPNDGKDMRSHIKKWKGNKLNRPKVHMDVK